MGSTAVAFIGYVILATSVQKSVGAGYFALFLVVGGNYSLFPLVMQVRFLALFRYRANVCFAFFLGVGERIHSLLHPNEVLELLSSCQSRTVYQCASITC